ncbi:MAG: hypothetical protein GY801_24310 [bacterium]|nr:hypothetical protein [bacterium]
MKQQDSETPFVFCLKNDRYEVSLEVRKIYPMLPDSQAAQHQLIRIIDESGEDYLYPIDYFVLIELPQTAAEAFATAA